MSWYNIKHLYAPRHYQDSKGTIRIELNCYLTLEGRIKTIASFYL